MYVNILPCLFSLHNTTSLSRHEQVGLIRLRFDIIEKCVLILMYIYAHIHNITHVTDI